MPRPPDHSLSIILLALLIFSNTSLLANAQQKRITQSHLTVAPQGKSTFFEDGTPKHDDHDVRAIATTFAPASATSGKAVRAPLAKSSAGSTVGLSRWRARSLQDWDVEDVVLLATVDGKLHAHDRRTGQYKWEIEADRPVVETTSHHRNKSIDGESPVNDEFLWIVEPSQDGSLYVFIPGVSHGVRKLGMTIKQLHELTPYMDDDPPIRYLVDRKTSLYTIDISNGKILKMFNAGSAAVLDDSSCRNVNDLANPEEEECPVTRTLNLGRTEYTLQISSAVTSELVCTIKYFEWGPNQRDQDLIGQYATTMDNRYIYTGHDGRAIASDLLQQSPEGYPTERRLIYDQKFSSPVAQVFDVVRQVKDDAPETPLIILPQPQQPMFTSNVQVGEQDKVFVNCTESGSWYALSENRYPTVTSRAETALCLKDDYLNLMPQMKSTSDSLFQKFLAGVHDLSKEGQTSHNMPVPLIGGPEDSSIDLQNDIDPVILTQYQPSETRSTSPVIWVIVVVCTIAGLFFPSALKIPSQHRPSITLGGFSVNRDIPVAPATPVAETKPAEEEPLPIPSDELEKKEITVELQRVKTEPSEAPTTFGESTAEKAKVEIVEPPEATVPKKKKAHRGQRGGRAQREKEKEKAKSTAQQRRSSSIDEDGEEVKSPKEEVTIKPDVISKHAPTSEAPNGLHNLHMRFDRILGSGSGGTFVFEGTFEGRDVAVKRMLRQQYELASQEVSLLEQNDEHPNVIRYFCRREDENFLYIALELCQASLWDLFRDGRGNELIEDKQLALRNDILQDPRRILRQLAEGLNYLHSFRIVHRDIKPQNMLIAYPKRNNLNAPPRLVISDFGLCKTLPENVSTLIGTTGNAGTAGWMAPELISQPKDSSNNGSFQSGEPNSQRSDVTMNGTANTSGKVKRAIDIFSLGCVFFYVLTHGQHPFDDEEGWMALRERNIKTGKAKNLKALDLLGPDTVDLVEWMLQHEPEDRPTASQVLAHPFFWNAEDRLEFLSAASDRFDQEPRDGTSPALKEVERSAEHIIPKSLPGVLYAQNATHSHLRSNTEMATTMQLPIPEPNFLAALDRRFVETLGRQRKYDPAKLTDLLRALRNKHHHWDDMPDDVKARVGEVPEGYLQFWETRFPGLVVRVWRTVASLGINNERRFGRWFANKGNTMN